MLSHWDGNTRKTVDKAYAVIIKCMFETLDVCAHQDLAEKDSLNLQIMNVGKPNLSLKICIIFIQKFVLAKFPH